MKCKLLILFIMSWGVLSAQQNDTWYTFYNADTTLIGFKDKHGTVQIEPKFTGVTFAEKFDNIIAVTENVNDKWVNYYLTKSGKKVGKDSMYIFDNGFDCESEGFIRFLNRETDKTGLLDKNGAIAVPAIYDAMTQVRNGMVVALKNATKQYWDGGNHSGCNHYSWIDGEELLIDAHNNVLIDSFSIQNFLDYFSLSISKRPSKDTLRVNFKARDGKFYSFIDIEKEFNFWLNDLLQNLTAKNLLKNSYDSIIFNGKTMSKNDFIANSFELVTSKLLLNNFHIFTEGLNPYIFDSPEFDDYFNNCGEAKEWAFPVMNVVINDEGKQHHFDFLRTGDGYKLVMVTIRN